MDVDVSAAIGYNSVCNRGAYLDALLSNPLALYSISIVLSWCEKDLGTILFTLRNLRASSSGLPEADAIPIVHQTTTLHFFRYTEKRVLALKRRSPWPQALQIRERYRVLLGDVICTHTEFVQPSALRSIIAGATAGAVEICTYTHHSYEFEGLANNV